jgi:hypothetical protein
MTPYGSQRFGFGLSGFPIHSIWSEYLMTLSRILMVYGVTQHPLLARETIGS